LIASADPFSRSENFPVQWEKLRELKAGYVDEHFYAPPDWFLQNTGRYDGYPRTGPKVFVGEYAAHLPPGPQGMRPSTVSRCARGGRLHDRPRAEQTREIVVKLVNPAAGQRVIQLALTGVTRAAGKSMTVLTGDRDAENSMNEPTRIAPRTSDSVPDPSKAWTLPPFSVTVVRIASE
jgi:alpha-L-arabinofuranosidase